ncbi:RagB/SusD family nutrient uptake outer membrane protein [Seonamhaeicola maritimus]|uniref:RagB/SusD family nutrient uptake outer membrane protein n=1 Tax=Seonamhaeicola maritimus TaxID=2591822 RepID=UPI00249500C9|nr:RagB/SusD family nutrient uptake outer membrane protein [Seonamhaeicola maritimus]
MKTIKYIYISLFCVILTCFTSCQLTEDLDDYEPLFSLEAETAIVDEATAELALTGIYSGYGSFVGTGNPYFTMFPSVMSGLGTPGFGQDDESRSIADNAAISTGTIRLRGGYTGLYSIINNANWLLQGIENLGENDFSSPARKDEIIAEAKAMRATANFYLLRLWGQFYDANSKYGINLRVAPATDDTAFPRNTVADSYTTILSDLDDAIATAPDLRAKFYVNKSYAKGLKAKVLLYQGEYSAAATLAQEVISGSGGDFQLAGTFGEIFDNTTDALFNSNELLFASRGIKNEEELWLGNIWGGFYAGLSQTYRDVFTGTVVIDGQTINYDSGDRLLEDFSQGAGKYAEFFPFAGENYEMIYHLRMAEMYLVFAEAHARSNNAVTTDALEALNAIRVRAGATSTGADGFETYPATITLSQFLEAVRVEKWAELGTEMGEEWFDLVRYHIVDGFDVSTVKPTATNLDKFILPIPTESREAGGNVVEQNPSY